MKLASLPLLLAAMTVQTAVAQAPSAGASSFLVRISDAQISMRPTAGPNNVSNCLLVYPDGRLHLELRRQEFFDGKASLVSYEARLSKQELSSLRSILNSDTLRSLQEFPKPRVPMSVDDWEVFKAEIQRRADVQDVGSFAWHGEGPKNSEDDKRAWLEAAKALQPLTEWSHSIKSFNRTGWQRVHNANAVCGR